MQHLIRRKLMIALLGAAAAPGLAGSVRMRAAGGSAPECPYVIPSAEPDAAMLALAGEAARWIARMHQQGQIILPYPVSRLQREFLTGYSYTCAVARLLADAGHWTIAFTGDGQRYARLHPVVQG